METKFTKGEWIVYTSDDEWGKTGRDEITIGMDSYNDDWSDHYCSHKVTINTKDDEAIANAHLIATAPDMYKEIEQDILWLERLSKDYVIGSYELRSTQLRIKSKKILLSKARGEK